MFNCPYISFIRSDFQRLQNKAIEREVTLMARISLCFSYSYILTIVYRSFGTLRTFKCLSPIASIFERLWIMVWKSELSSLARFGPGLLVIHGFSIVVNPGVVAGVNCTLYQGVTLGVRFPGDGNPVLGNRVVVGAGACVFGPVSIPDDSLIPSNSVITPNSLHLVQRLRSLEGYGFIANS